MERLRVTRVLATSLLLTLFAACSPAFAPGPTPAPGAEQATGTTHAARPANGPVRRGSDAPRVAIPADRPLTLGEARARILDKANLRLAADAYRTAEAQGDVQQAALPPNPYVMLRKRRISNLDVLGTGFGEVEVGQPFELGRKRAARVAAAQAEAAAVGERVRALALLTLHDTEASFFRLLRLQQDLDVAREAEAAATELEALARTRHEAGKDSRVPVLRFRAAAQNASLAVQDVKRRHASACRQMDDLLGLPVGSTRGVDGAWEGKGPGDLDRDAAHVALLRHPRRLVADRELSAACRGVRRADANAWPNVTVGLAGEHDADLDRDYVGLSLYVPVPLWNRNQGQRTTARAAVGRARKTVEAETLELAVELDRAILLLERSSSNVDGFEGQIIPTLDTSVELARQAYEGGKGSYLDVLDALLAWIRARRERLGHLEERAQATVAIRYLTGVL